MTSFFQTLQINLRCADCGEPLTAVQCNVASEVKVFPCLACKYPLPQPEPQKQAEPPAARCEYCGIVVGILDVGVTVLGEIGTAARNYHRDCYESLCAGNPVIA